MDKQLDSVELDRAKHVATVNEKYAPKAKEVPIVKVWTKEKIDATDIKIKKEVKIAPKNENTLF